MQPWQQHMWYYGLEQPLYYTRAAIPTISTLISTAYTRVIKSIVLKVFPNAIYDWSNPGSRYTAMAYSRVDSARKSDSK